MKVLGQGFASKILQPIVMSQYGVSHAAILSWFASRLPETDAERGALVWHQPVSRHRLYNPERFTAYSITLSLTPTEGVYQRLNEQPKTGNLLFLHRPWGLDRARVRYGTLVLQSHTRFDELYTTGYNIPFAARHFVDLDTIQCLQGYKSDPERRIGLLAKLQAKYNLRDYLRVVADDFGGFELQQIGEDPLTEVHAIACLNAFNDDIVQRIKTGLADVACQNILCITGAAREAGLVAAKECGLQVLCVGHRRSEMWGLRYLAASLVEELGVKDIAIVDEPDFVPERTVKEKTVPDPAPTVDLVEEKPV